MRMNPEWIERKKGRKEEGESHQQSNQSNKPRQHQQTCRESAFAVIVVDRVARGMIDMHTQEQSAWLPSCYVAT